MLTTEELETLAKNAESVSLLGVLHDSLPELKAYFAKIQTPAKMITAKSLKKHETYLAEHDPIAMLLDEIIKKYRISVKLLQSVINANTDVTVNLTCPICGKPLTHTNYFVKTCSVKCGAIYAQLALRKTNLEKYGVQYAWQADEVKERIKCTNMEKYGVANPSQIDAVKEKAKATCQRKYGVDNASQSEVIKAKVRSTNMAKYGVECAFSAEEVKQSIRETNMRKYGSEYYTSTDEFKKKARETFLQNYGVENPLLSEEVQSKIQCTVLERYGVENVAQSGEIQAKVRKTNLEKYGNEVFVKSDAFKAKVKETNLVKYGVEYVSQSSEIQERIKNTNLEKYGTPFTSQSEIVKKKVRLANREKTYDFFLSLLKARNLEPLDTKESILTSGSIRLKCLTCGEAFETAYDAATYQSSVFCPKCHPKYNKPETEICTFLQQYIPDSNIIHKDRKVLNGKELDLYISDKKLAIEFDGLYWHNTDYHTRTYHLEKTEECKKKGIQLIHIFEHEWQYKQQIVKSIILSKLHIFSNVIFARKSKIAQLTNAEYRQFLQENHIQGYAPASIRLGLTYNDELVACIGIGKSRFKNGETELIRFCTKLNTQIIGGLSKLIKNAKLNTPLVSYVDRRYFDGQGYISAGFKELYKISPGYIYCRKNETLSRYQCQKHKLKKLLGSSFDESLTEKQNMILAGYQQIYDCGMLKLIYGDDKSKCLIGTIK